MPTVAASGRASSWAATAATAPVRSAVTARTSTSASSSPSSADDTQIAPITTGRPAAGFPRERRDPLEDRDAARPLAGIARKSPPGGAWM